MNNRWLLIVFLSMYILSCQSQKDEKFIRDFDTENNGNGNTSNDNKPLFVNSIASTDLDFIKATDPDAFESVVYKGQEEKEMPGGTSDEIIDENTYVFEASFTNNKKIQIWAHSNFGSKNNAEVYVNKLTDKLGKLPVFLRDQLLHVVVHKGDGGAFAEDLGKFFVLYSDNMDTRIGNNDLEETVFHESVHVALDLQYAESDSWLKAQKDDNLFVTNYAQSRPKKEDLAETAIFVYTMMKYPERLPANVEEWVKTNIPNRYKFLKEVLK
jgi:hypothetical protein